MDMTKLKTNIKRFFSNPNTITFILVIGLIVVIYLVYSYMINRAIAPINVPYCTNEIKTKSEITNDSMGTIQISGNFVTASGSNLLQSQRAIRNKYVTPGYFIPKNSFFYADAVSDSSAVEKTMYDNIPNQSTLYQLDVDFHKTYGCSIMTGNYIDIYIKAVDPQDDNKLIFAPFITSIRVEGVFNNQGEDVFVESTASEPKPAKLVFNVSNDLHELLVKSEHIPKYKIELIPVPRNSGYTETPKQSELNPTIEALINENSELVQ